MKVDPNPLVNPHIFHECQNENCATCRNGLAYCVVCRAGEGELLTSCPGHRLNAQALADCCNGRVVDLIQYRFRRLIIQHEPRFS